MPPTVMVVDDDENIRTILRYRLEREDYAVQVACDGWDALKQVQEHPPDLIVLDLMMPDMDGIQFLAQLRSNPQSARIPLIVLTALGPEPYGEQTHELGAAAVVTKPFSPRRLVEQVRQVLDDECVAMGNENCWERGNGERASI
jgi:DNA-binding response OmpR family regulator